MSRWGQSERRLPVFFTPFHNPRARLLPSHQTLIRAVSVCQRLYGAAEIAAALAAGMRLSRNFALGWRNGARTGKLGHFNPPAIVRPQPERITKNVPGRAVDVNRPVTPWCVPDAVLATRTRTVTGGLTSTARLVRWGGVRKTTSGFLTTVSPSQPRPGMVKR